MGNFIDLTGKQFGRLTVLKKAIGKYPETRWLCECACGNTAIVRSISLRNGDTKSCGCLNIEMIRARSIRHGHCVNGKISPEYRAWEHMLNRCNDQNGKDYPDYGGRGIKVCSRWNNFKLFYKDMGPRPGKKYSIDRIDVNSDYEPKNCRWATDTVQARNQRVRKTSGTGVKGVTYRSDVNKYRASIGVNYKRIQLGYFDTIEEAEQARKIAEIKYWEKSS